MKAGTRLILLFMVLFIANSCTKSRNQQHIYYDRTYKTQIEKAHQEMGYFLSANFIPGGSIAVMKNGKLIYSEGLGTASKDLDVFVKRDTKFRIGSISEIFTALIFRQMEEQGLISSDSSIQHYYPGFPEKESKLEVSHLVQHTSGIRVENYEEESWRALNVSLQKGVERVMNDPLIFTPGDEQMESMWNYNLLGALMEKTTNKRYHELLKEYLTDTLNLTHTSVDHPLMVIKGRTNFYDHNIISQVVNATTTDLRYRAPSSGLLSSSEDLAKLGSLLITSDYFSDNFREKLFEKFNLNNGIPATITNGWYTLNDEQGNTMYGRIGSIKGGSAALFIYPDEELVVACCTNLTDSTNDLPILKIANYFLPEKENSDNQNTVE